MKKSRYTQSQIFQVLKEAQASVPLSCAKQLFGRHHSQSHSSPFVPDL
jgi:hypothetical protein